MLHRLMWIVLTTLALATSGSGCCCLDRYYYGDCQSRGLSGALSGRCGDGGCASGDCGGGCADGGCADGDCGAPECGDCGSCGRCCPHPFRAFWGMLTCSSGCGEFYWDEWFSDPPAACDPCDNHGCFTGHGGCRPRWWLGVRGAHGDHCASCCDTSCGLACGGDCGEADCGCGDGYGGEHEELLREVIPTPEMEATPTPMPVESARRPYYTAPKTRQASYNAPAARTHSASTRTVNYTTPRMAGEPVGTGVMRR